MLPILIIFQFRKFNSVSFGFVLIIFPSIQNKFFNSFVRIHNQVHIQAKNVAKVRQIFVEAPSEELPLISTNVVQCGHQHNIWTWFVCLSASYVKESSAVLQIKCIGTILFLKAFLRVPVIWQFKQKWKDIQWYDMCNLQKFINCSKRVHDYTPCVLYRHTITTLFTDNLYIKYACIVQKLFTKVSGTVHVPFNLELDDTIRENLKLEPF